MINISQHCYSVFMRSITDYHIHDDVEATLNNPYDETTLDALLYKKNWIDTVQWHLEDIVRDPDISGDAALAIKRRIDRLNQIRTDTVEQLDDYFQTVYGEVEPLENARHNTESIGWAIDRLSILALKEFHWNMELNRADATLAHLEACQRRKRILSAQKEDLLSSINWLIDDIRSGKKINKVYRQLKMYNDPSFNPVLYKKQEQQ